MKNSDNKRFRFCFYAEGWGACLSRFYNAATKFKYFISLLICASALVGCHPGTIFEIFNNTGENIIVATFDAKLNETRFQVMNGQSVTIGLPSRLEIHDQQGIWKYTGLRPVPRQFQKKLRPNVYIEKYQVEPNGEIHVISPDAKEVGGNFPVQPAGYPVKPE